MIALHLGNPFDLDAICAFRRGPWPVVGGGLLRRPRQHLEGTHRDLKGTFGHLATLSSTNPPSPWGGRRGSADQRSTPSCARSPSQPATGPRLLVQAWLRRRTGKRFGWRLGSLPTGYDPEITPTATSATTSKITDMQAACGLAQLDRLEGFHVAALA